MKSMKSFIAIMLCLFVLSMSFIPVRAESVDSSGSETSAMASESNTEETPNPEGVENSTPNPESVPSPGEVVSTQSQGGSDESPESVTESVSESAAESQSASESASDQQVNQYLNPSRSPLLNRHPNPCRNLLSSLSLKQNLKRIPLS